MSQTIARPFTSRTYVSLAIARGIAAGYGHADLTGCHVALGLLREGENPAVAALESAGVSLRSLRIDVESALPERGHPMFGEIVLPSTPGERAIVEAAEAEAASLKQDYVSNEHLLLALLRDAESSVARVFSRHGITHETAVAYGRAVLAGDVSDIRSELRREYERICPDDESDTWMRMLTADLRRILEELRRVPDGAGHTAVVVAFKAASRPQLHGA